MGRKQNRPASSAAAAALSNTPTFTSFAAATAHALPIYSVAQPTPTSTPWDESALNILKRLSKRDTTTKQRALADLNDHLNDLSDSDPPAGQIFVAAWGPAFCTALEDDAPTVRSAALSLMALTVRTFRRLVQPIFPVVLPPWVAATGDLNPSVADAANKSLLQVLPTPTHCEKVAAKYGSNLREYVVKAIAGLSSSTFRTLASRALAVLAWLLDAAKTSDLVAPIVDDPANPLQVLAKGINKSTANAAPQVCTVAINALSYMTPTNTAHVKRARRFADLSALVIGMREPAGWDLALVLLRSGWYLSFGDSFGKLPAAVRDAVTAPIPTGLQALLPLFDAFPRILASSEFALFVLSGIRDELKISQLSDNSSAPSVSYSLTALPTFLEVACFVYTDGARRWLSDDEDRLAVLEELTFADYIAPACRLFLNGLLPSTPRSSAGQIGNGSSSKKGSESISRNPVQEIAIHIARVLRALKEPRAARAFVSFAEAFVDSIEKPNLPERLWRLQCVLQSTKDLRCQRRFSHCVIEKLVSTEQNSEEATARTLAVVLSTRGSSAVMTDNLLLTQYESLVSSILGFARVAVRKLCETQKLKRSAEFEKDLGTIYSWVLGTASAINIEDPLTDIINAVKLSCTPEETYQLLTLVVRAHKTRRDFDNVSSWGPIRGKEFDDVVMDAMADACGDDGGTNAAFLIATAVDPSEGSCVSEVVLNKIANRVTSYLKSRMDSDILDGVTRQLLRSPLRLSSTDRNEALRNLTATSILRAPHDSAMMGALLTQLRGSTRQDLLEMAKMMIAVLLDSSLPLESYEIASAYAQGIANVILLIGEGSIEDSVLLCEKLLVSFSPSFTTEILKHVPFRFVFGNGTDVPIRMNHLTVALERAYPIRYAGFMEDVESFVQFIEADVRARVTVHIAVRYLTSRNEVHRGILGAMVSAMSRNAQNGVGFRLIAQKLHELLTRDSGSTKETERIPEVVRMCSQFTNGGCLDEFRDLLDAAIRIIRRDSYSFLAGIAVDIVTASLTYVGNEEGGIPRHPWLKDLVSLCLRALRRCFERSHGRIKTQLHATEARAASLTCNALQCFGRENICEDDIRFWALRCTDTMRSFVQTSSNEDEISQEVCASLASIASLSLELIRLGEQKEAPHTMSSMVDELSHWASWVSVLLFPTIEIEEERKSRHDAKVPLIDTDSAGKVIMKAAELGTLLTCEGGLPVKAKYLYRLVPYLASRTVLSRKAVLTVLTHGATIDLQDAVSRSFPDKGFGDENEEIRFATNMIPSELRTTLQWQAEVPNESAQSSQDVRTRELGYFLAWRLFLDLIRGDEDTTLRSTSVSGDLSFRRVGITYLRANPTIFATFLSKCIEVVVDGSVREQAAAGAAASKALEVEEKVAQGIQLVQQEGFDMTGEGNSISIERRFCEGEGEDEIEYAVGHAAGIVFARALQRLPALSRDHVMDQVDRGTSARVESFVRKKVSPLLIAAEIRKVKEWGAFGGGAVAQSSSGDSVEGELNARGSVAGREVWATYTFSDVTLEIGMRLPDTFPLQSVQVEARSRVGMSEARWRKTLLGMTTLLRSKDGSLTEAVELWRRNLDKTFQGAEECPICYSVLHLSTAALPKMQCRTCKNLFHSDCLCKWFTKSNSSACPLCRSAF